MLFDQYDRNRERVSEEVAKNYFESDLLGLEKLELICKPLTPTLEFNALFATLMCSMSQDIRSNCVRTNNSSHGSKICVHKSILAFTLGSYSGQFATKERYVTELMTFVGVSSVVYAFDTKIRSLQRS